MRGKAFVGFGFGPIQTGLMLLEAAESGTFSSLAVAEIDADLVQAVRRGGSSITINIAGTNGIRKKTIEGVRIYNPRDPRDRAALLSAIAEADELATAVPSVSLYSQGGETSIAALIAEGAGPGRKRILYAAENHNSAAEILRREVLALSSEERLQDLQFLNTVIGKMSGVITSLPDIERLDLAPLVPGLGRCFLVEEFNRILIDRITLPGYVRGIGAFEEKQDLLPFEEAKLFGHNAIHALLGYMARLSGLEAMSEIRDRPHLMELGRKAFLEESGAALVSRHRHTGDALFTEAGFKAYAEDLLERMTNPWLADRVERIVRDPLRKLGYGDRFFGAMREALRLGIEPKILARGAAAAALFAMDPAQGPGRVAKEADARRMRELLETIWAGETPDQYRPACMSLVLEAMPLVASGGG